jgi:hypothetical protein
MCLQGLSVQRAVRRAVITQVEAETQHMLFVVLVLAAGLSYAPPTGSNGNGVASSNGATAVAEPMGMQTVTATITAPRPPAASSAATAAAPSAAPAPDKTLFSMDEEEMTSDQIQCRWALCDVAHDLCSSALV